MTGAVVATLIGDLVGSRGETDRRALHDRLTAALAEGADALGGDLVATAPLQIQAGDEFQGGFRTIGAALHAALLIRMDLRVGRPDADLRCGLGWGHVQVLDRRTGVQDGPGWWAARDAIVEAERLERAPSSRTVRTIARLGPDQEQLQDAVNAALATRDHLLARLDDRSLRILHRMLRQETKRQIAQAEGISASAVSQRASRDGLDAIVRDAALLRGI
ncbi:SatD family protein [Branchiibius sp. NY16-3462-2]|uniref:SatD family protein n=1 Tax=Branchiibius sp. NY16-3462-2 TaxID=1807500 RepID=UPI000794BCC3|nr:SatD family protein [Branchiibius sp. NY16-3462-2]KYH45471.1 hypothetical protein AZH51_00735 [Branchiibius sp. NY16-3462-2]